MKNKLFLILTFFCFSFFSFAAGSQNAEIRSAVYDIEAKLSKNIEQQIVQFVGTDNIWVSTHFSVSLDRLEAEIKKRNEASDAPTGKKYDDLPGLNISEDGAFVKDLEEEKIILIEKESHLINSAMIFAHTDVIKVRVYHKAKLEKKVERVIRSLIEEKMSSLKVKVEVKFDQRKARAFAETDFDEGQKVRFDPDTFVKSFHGAVVMTFQEFLDKHLLSPFKTGAIIFIALGFIVFGLATYFLAKTLQTINSSLKAVSTALAASEGSSSKGRGDFSANDVTVNELAEVSSKEAFPSEESEAKAKILEIYENYREVITNFLQDSMEKKNFQDMWTLTQVLGEKLLFENIQIVKSKNFRDYNMFLRENLFNDIEGKDYRKLYQKLMGLMLYPDVYFMNEIKGQLAQLNHQKLTELTSLLSTQEKSFLGEILESSKLASLINQGLLNVEDVRKEGTSLEFDKLNALSRKVSLHLQKSDIEGHKILQVLMNLNQFQFDTYLINMNVSEKFHFSNLYHDKKEEADEFFKSLSPEEICCLLPMLSPEIGDSIIENLPEIKLARVKQGSKEITPASQKFMKKVYSVLLTSELKYELIQELEGGESQEGLKVA